MKSIELTLEEIINLRAIIYCAVSDGDWSLETWQNLDSKLDQAEFELRNEMEEAK